jgi:hypothetical protein
LVKQYLCMWGVLWWKRSAAQAGLEAGLGAGPAGHQNKHLSEELEVVVVKLSRRLQLNVGVDKLAEEEGWTVGESMKTMLICYSRSVAPGQEPRLLIVVANMMWRESLRAGS